MPFIEFGRDPLSFIAQPPGWSQEAWRRHEQGQHKDTAAAVITAVRRMNQLGKGQSTSVMAVSSALMEDIESLSSLISAINDDIRSNVTLIGTSKIIAWGGFLQEWMIFKQRAAAIPENEARPLLQILRERAILWAGEVGVLVRAGKKPEPGVEITWKKLILGTAMVVGAVWLCRKLFGDQET